jgi:hypothetical protein
VSTAVVAVLPPASATVLEEGGCIAAAMGGCLSTTAKVSAAIP